MTQLYSDLVDGSGRRYYYSLSRAPGGASPASQAIVTVVGQVPNVLAQITVFRTPTQATLNIFGYQPPSLTPVQPGVGAVTLAGLIPTEQKIRVITNSLPSPDYSTPNELIPTIVFVQTVIPSPAALQIQALTLNAFPGGDIVYVSPGVGLVSMQGLNGVIINNAPGIGMISISGQIPALAKEIVVSPDLASITINGLASSAAQGFV